MYALVENDQIAKYPYSVRDLQKSNPSTSFPRKMSPALLRAHGVYEVVPAPRPHYDELSQDLVEAEPKFVDGALVQEWEIREKNIIDTKENYSLRLAARRFESETAGISVEGVALPTDDRTKMLLTAKVVRALIAKSENDRDWECLWKGAYGWVRLNADQVIALGKALDDYVQSAFDRESEISQIITSAKSLSELRGVDLSSGWPSREIPK